MLLHDSSCIEHLAIDANTAHLRHVGDLQGKHMTCAHEYLVVLCVQHQRQTALCRAAQVLHEYQRRDSLMQQLLSERDEMRRSSRRSNTESSKLERERDEAVKTAAKLKVGAHTKSLVSARTAAASQDLRTTGHTMTTVALAGMQGAYTSERAVLRCLQTELSDVRSVEIPAMESRHKEAMSKLNSEVARLKHAVKEAEAVAAAAQAEVLAASTQPTLQGQLHDAVRERERCAA